MIGNVHNQSQYINLFDNLFKKIWNSIIYIGIYENEELGVSSTKHFKKNTKKSASKTKASCWIKESYTNFANFNAAFFSHISTEKNSATWLDKNKLSGKITR